MGCHEARVLCFPGYYQTVSSITTRLDQFNPSPKKRTCCSGYRRSYYRARPRARSRGPDQASSSYVFGPADLIPRARRRGTCLSFAYLPTSNWGFPCAQSRSIPLCGFVGTSRCKDRRKRVGIAYIPV
jgi:hypothetical protein